MIYINYLLDAIEGETGPNLYWYGEPSDYLKAVNLFHPLGVHNGIELRLSEAGFTKIKGDFDVILRSSPNGRLLVCKQSSDFIIDVDRTMWQQVILLFLAVSFDESHNYIDADAFALDQRNVVEDANFIISSEANQSRIIKLM